MMLENCMQVYCCISDHIARLLFYPRLFPPVGPRRRFRQFKFIHCRINAFVVD